MVHSHVWLLGRAVWKAGLSQDCPPEHLHAASPQAVGLLTWKIRPPRSTRSLSLRSDTTPFRHFYTLSYWLRSHKSPQIYGRDCRCCLLMESGPDI